MQSRRTGESTCDESAANSLIATLSSRIRSLTHRRASFQPEHSNQQSLSHAPSIRSQESSLQPPGVAVFFACAMTSRVARPSTPPPQPSEAKRLPFYSNSEVAAHNVMEDCWVSYFGNVYDLTKLVQENKGARDDYQATAACRLGAVIATAPLEQPACVRADRVCPALSMLLLLTV